MGTDSGKKSSSSSKKSGSSSSLAVNFDDYSGESSSRRKHRTISNDDTSFSSHKSSSSNKSSSSKKKSSSSSSKKSGSSSRESRSVIFEDSELVEPDNPIGSDGKDKKRSSSSSELSKSGDSKSSKKRSDKDKKRENDEDVEMLIVSQTPKDEKLSHSKPGAGHDSITLSLTENTSVSHDLLSGGSQHTEGTPTDTNPFVKSSELKMSSERSINPFLHEEKKVPVVIQSAVTKTTKNRIMEKIDPSVAERLQAGENISNEQALLLTIEKLTNRTEKLDELRFHLMDQIKALEDMLEERESKIKALEYYFKKLETGGGPGSASVIPLASSDDDDDDSSYGRRNGPVAFTANRGRVRDSMFATDITLQEDGPPPKLSSTFQRAGAKVRRAKESVNPQSNAWDADSSGWDYEE